ncbi:MAG TPA: family 16 glycoside hydrolase, partial [Ilumatobacter sp.]
AIKDGDTIVGGGKTTVKSFEQLDGTLEATPESATPFVNEDTTVSAAFTPSGTQSPANRAVTFQVYRLSRLSGLPAGYASGTPYVRVKNEVVNTDASGVARHTYRGDVIANDIVVACLGYEDSCLKGSETTLVVDDQGNPVNLREGVIADRSAIEWKLRPASGEWTSLWDGVTFAGWDHAGSGGFQRVIDDGAPSLQAQGSGGILWYNAREFADYELEVSYEHNGVSDNGGIFLRFPNPGENRSIADQGYQVAILDRVDDVANRTGSIIGYAAAQKLNAKPVGEGYNTFRIRFVGTRIEVYLNESAQANADPVAVYDNADKATQGFVGIENAGASIRYRDIRVKELKAGIQRPLARVTATPESGVAPLEVAFRGDATDPEGQGITYTWDFGDGATGEGQVISHTYPKAGYYQAKVTATDAKGAQDSAGVEIAVASPGECLRTAAGYCVADLTGHYNTDGISEHGDFDDGNFDDAGWAYAGDTMPPAGPVTLLDIPFEFPSYAPGRKNTVEARGQMLPFAPGNYDEVKLLAAAHHGSPDTQATINYADGSTEQVRLALTDWAQSPRFGERVAIAAGHRHDQDSDTGPPVNIFVQTLPLDPDRAVRSITLPNERRIHLFSVALKVPPTCTVQGTAEGETLTGTDGDDVLCGAGGNDVLLGKGGNDILRGGAGDDRLVGGDGSDDCAGQAGTDTARECELQSGTSTMTLTPAHASTYTNETHELVAAFGGDDPVPPAGTDVVFEVYKGADKVGGGVVDSAANGTAPFSTKQTEKGEYSVVACTGAATCGDDATRLVRATFKVVDPPQLEPDYQLLFDGATKDGWLQSGPGEFRVEDGSLISDGGLGLLWYSAREFGDFSLKMSWKVEDGTDNSGVFVRFPNTGTVHNTAINEGHEIQVHEGANTSEPQKTGSIYNFKREEQRNSNPIGEWNDYEIRAKGRTLTVILNGEVVNTFTGSEPRTKLTGYFGLQNHDSDSHVHYRYVRIRELENVAPTTTATLDPAQPGPSGFYTGPVKVTLSAADNDGGSGVAKTEYRVDGGEWTTYTQPFDVTGDGP